MAITPAIAWAGVMLSAGMIQRHRANIRRMLSGEEPPTNNR
jgi:glycerol-3-phosphate acyltransferase PlsY